jgi:hypothetical protein
MSKESINKNLLSQKQLEEENAKESERKKKEYEERKAAINRVFTTVDGKVLGKWLLEQCGFFQSNIVVTNGDISLSLTMYNEARRNIYLELRKFFDSDTLIKLEIEE